MSCSQSGSALVTVIIPSYNHAKYITETVQSVFNQTHKDIEVIIIDDNSRDNSIEVIRRLQDSHSFTFISHNRNMGLPATLNEAIALAKGKYICIVASDDHWPSHKLEIQVEVMENNSNYAVCFGKQIGFNEKGDLKKFEIPRARSGFIFDSLLTWEFSIPALTAMIRKSALDTVGPYDETIAIEDWYIWLKLAKMYPFYYIDDYLGFYRLHANNMSKKQIWMVNEKQKILDLWTGDPLHRHAQDVHNIMSFWKLSSSHKSLSLRYLLKSRLLLDLKSRYFYKGLIKLILPRRDYSF